MFLIFKDRSCDPYRDTREFAVAKLFRNSSLLTVIYFDEHIQNLTEEDFVFDVLALIPNKFTEEDAPHVMQRLRYRIEKERHESQERVYINDLVARVLLKTFPEKNLTTLQTSS